MAEKGDGRKVQADADDAAATAEDQAKAALEEANFQKSLVNAERLGAIDGKRIGVLINTINAQSKTALTPDELTQIVCSYLSATK